MHMTIILSGVSYHYHNQQPLFEVLNLSVGTGRKVSLIGNNGTGKSTLLKLIAGELPLSSGSICCSSQPYYVPQQIGITGIEIGEALGVADKIRAFHAICNGSVCQFDYETLNDDWDIESNCRAALDDWGLQHVKLTASIDTLSSGEKTKLFLAGLMIHHPAIVLLDEPTNHLDVSGRQKLYDFILGTKATVVVVSHDITLLNLLDTNYELTSKGLKLYGGNYDFYCEQKEVEDRALEQHIDTEQTALRLARKKAQEVRERQEKRMRHGEANKDQLPRIMRKGLKDKGERTSARLGDKHSEILSESHLKLSALREQRRVNCELKIDFEDAQLHHGKLLISTKAVNFGYVENQPLWKLPLDLEIRSGERVQLCGENGSGKTTLVKLLTGVLKSAIGDVFRTDFSSVYLDQEYSKINSEHSVLELAQEYNCNNLQEHEIKLRLHRALFPKEMWDKSCQVLSGGEKMRLCLCCLMISNHVPDLFILDEPTNNLDLSSLAILTDTIKNYRGTLLVISHDQNFVRAIGITKKILLEG